MKKLLSAALALCLLLTVGALADPAYRTEEAVRFENASANSIYGLDGYVSVYSYTTRGRGIADLTGELLIPAEYQSVNHQSFGLFTASVSNDIVNRYAIINLDNEVLTAYDYYTFDVRSDKWVVGRHLSDTPTDGEEHDATQYVDGESYYYLYDRCDLIYLPTGKTLSLTRDAYDMAQPYGDYLLVRDREGNLTLYDSELNTVENNFTGIFDMEYAAGDDGAMHSRITGETWAENLYSLSKSSDKYYTAVSSESRKPVILDPQGNILCEIDCSYLYGIRGDYAEIVSDNKVGLVDIASGETVIPCKYDNLKTYQYTSFVYNGYVAVENEGKIGFVDLNGNVTCPVIYPEDSVSLLGCSMFMTAPDGTLTLIAADGTVTPLPGITEIYEYPNGFDGSFIEVADESENYAVFDWHGEPVTEFISPYSSGFSMVSKDLILENFDDSVILRVIAADETAPAEEPVPVEEPEPTQEPEPTAEPIEEPAIEPTPEPAEEPAPESGEERLTAFNFCPNCGTSTNNGSFKFCPNCGYQLGE